MKKILLACTVLFVISIVSCQKNDNESAQPASQGDVLKMKQNPADEPIGTALSQTVIDKRIKSILESTHDFGWENISLTYLWSAAQYGNHAVAVGYKTIDIADIGPIIHQVKVREGKFKAVHDAIINLVVAEVNKTAEQKVRAADIIIEDDPILPIITFNLTDRSAITKLYNLENVRYIEPLDYKPQDNELQVESSSGCSGSSYALNASDYSTTTPGCLVPWNYNNLNIPTAWNTAQGVGIKIGVIDAGMSATQSLLGSQFTSGMSAGNRTVTTDYTIGSSAYSSCAHGTLMSGLATGPRNDQNAITGVAYQASLHFIHACDDVVLDAASEKTGVKNACVRMGDMTDIKIISMSVGAPFASSVLKDGVTYAYNKGKMVLAAAGTSFSWTSWWGVIYPAAYSQCYAITGVNETGSTCNDCHDGSQVKFTIPMERNGNTSRNSLSLNLNNSTPAYIGGSSAATATMAGIAGLVWSVKPTLTRQQVFDILKNTSQYVNSTSKHGYGNPNASAAVALALTY
ncbi:MAG: S8 family serine peptidase [Bacteroidota bacterium]